MRTTLDIETPVLEELKRLRDQEPGKSLGRIASELLQQALAHRLQNKKPSDGLTWQSRAMSPRVDLEDKDALYERLDGGR